MNLINDRELLFSSKSVVLKRKRPVLISEKVTYKKSEKNIIIKPIIVGICRSDIKEAQGIRTVRSDFGHEIVGEVEWANSNIGLSKSDVVCFDPHIPLIRRSSGFSEYMIAYGEPSELMRAFVKVDSNISHEKLVFCEPTACAYNCVRNLMKYLNCDSLRGYRIGIIGAGTAGMLIGLLIKYFKGDIVLFNRGENKLNHLNDNKIFSMEELNKISKNYKYKFDAVIPATSFLFNPVLNFSYRILKENGLLLLYGGTKEKDLLPGSNIFIDSIRRNEKIIEVMWLNKKVMIGGTYGASTDDFLNVIEIFSQSPEEFPIERSIVKKLSLDELVKEFNQLISSNYYYGKRIIII